LDYSKIEAGKMNIQLYEFDLVDALHAVLKGYQYKPGRKE
jgi:hypothetical protein